MPFKCSAPRCTNSNKDGYCFIKFAHDPELRRKWIDAVGIADWEPSKTAVLCEVHFHSSELFRIGNKKFIKKGAIPSLFCNCDESVKLERKETFEQVVHNESCCVKKLPVDIKMLMELGNETISAKESNINDICNTNVELLQTYKVMQIKLQNIIQENNVLKERCHSLQDDLTHIKSFTFHM